MARALGEPDSWDWFPRVLSFFWATLSSGVKVQKSKNSFILLDFRPFTLSARSRTAATRIWTSQDTAETKLGTRDVFPWGRKFTENVDFFNNFFLPKKACPATSGILPVQNCAQGRKQSAKCRISRLFEHSKALLLSCHFYFYFPFLPSFGRVIPCKPIPRIRLACIPVDLIPDSCS